MEIITLKLSELHTAKKNTRMHPPEQIREYKRSLVKFGQTKPIVIDENNEILIGNGLFMAIKELGWDGVACIRKDGLSVKDKKKLMLADNRIFDLGTDDLSVFDEFIAELNGDFDIPGYSDELLNSLIMDSDQASEMLSEYGTIDEEDAENIRNASVPAAPTMKYEAPVNDNSYTPDTAYVPDTDVGNTGREVTPDRKYVVCPKCGEKIWL